MAEPFLIAEIQIKVTGFDQAIKALQRIQNTAAGIEKTAAALGLIEQQASRIGQVAPQVERLNRALSSPAVAQQPQRVDAATNAYLGLGQAIKDSESTLGQTQQRSASLTQQINEIGRKGRTGFRDLNALVANAERNAAQLEQRFKSANRELDRLSKSGQKFQIKQQDDIARKFRAANTELDRLVRSGQKFQLRDTQQLQRRLKEANAELDRMVRAGQRFQLRDAQQAAAAFKRANTQLNALVQPLQRATQRELRQLRRFVAQSNLQVDLLPPNKQAEIRAAITRIEARLRRLAGSDQFQIQMIDAQAEIARLRSVAAEAGRLRSRVQSGVNQILFAAPQLFSGSSSLGRFVQFGASLGRIFLGVNRAITSFVQLVASGTGALARLAGVVGSSAVAMGILTGGVTIAIGLFAALTAGALALIGVVTRVAGAILRLAGEIGKLVGQIVGAGLTLALRGLEKALSLVLFPTIALYRSLQRIIRTLPLLATFILPLLIRNLREAASELQRIRALFRLAFGANSQREMEKVIELANSLGLSLEDAAEPFARLSFAARQVGLSLEETTSLFQGVSQGAVALGLSGERVTSVFVALEQIASRGAVSMEELRRQASNAFPGFLLIAARSLNISVAELEKRVRSGTLASRDLLKALGPELQRTFRLAAFFRGFSIEAQVARIRNQMLLFRDKIAQSVIPAVLRFQQALLQLFTTGKVLERLEEFAERIAFQIDKIRVSPTVAGLLQATANAAESLAKHLATTLDYFGQIVIIANGSLLVGMRALAEIVLPKINALLKKAVGYIEDVFKVDIRNWTDALRVVKNLLQNSGLVVELIKSVGTVLQDIGRRFFQAVVATGPALLQFFSKLAESYEEFMVLAFQRMKDRVLQVFYEMLLGPTISDYLEAHLKAFRKAVAGDREGVQEALNSVKPTAFQPAKTYAEQALIETEKLKSAIIDVGDAFTTAFGKPDFTPITDAVAKLQAAAFDEGLFNAERTRQQIIAATQFLKRKSEQVFAKVVDKLGLGAKDPPLPPNVDAAGSGGVGSQFLGLEEFFRSLQSQSNEKLMVDEQRETNELLREQNRLLKGGAGNRRVPNPNDISLNARFDGGLV